MHFKDFCTERHLVMSFWADFEINKISLESAQKPITRWRSAQKLLVHFIVCRYSGTHVGIMGAGRPPPARPGGGGGPRPGAVGAGRGWPDGGCGLLTGGGCRRASLGRGDGGAPILETKKCLLDLTGYLLDVSHRPTLGTNGRAYATCSVADLHIQSH